MRKYIPFAFKNSLRNKRRTILTIASISVSLFLLGMLIAIYHAFYFRAAPPEQALRWLEQAARALDARGDAAGRRGVDEASGLLR